jgi:apolipoprotein N-acyltransferase
VVTLALAYGGWRLVRERSGRLPVTVGLVAADRPEQPTDSGTEEGRRLLTKYAREAAALAAQGALAVCKDMDFPGLGRRYAERGVSMLLVPAWDFTADGWLHSRMAVLRGVEGGFAVVRAARGGRLTVSDDRGRIVAEATSAEAPVVSLLAEVRVGRAGTPYSALGDWFAWLSGGLFAVALFRGVRAGSVLEA